jgi:tetratricopeptide (TPR) repeat protein
MTPEPPAFLEVAALIERSEPRARHGWLAYAAGVFLLLVVLTTYLSLQGLTGVVQSLSALAMLGVMVTLVAITWNAAKRQRAEMQQVEAVEELVQLRRWPQAALLVQSMLSEPTRSLVARVQALVYLSSILARYQRFEDAIAVQTYLLTHVGMDDRSSHGLRLGRAMAMLREDHLVDADRAISELRRSEGGKESGGLALVEIYRDVKTGHPAEAIERFEKSLPMFQEQLGHRTGDAYALLAKAYDMLGRSDEARTAYEKATLLTAVSELDRRYPEVATLRGKYPLAPIPAGADMGALS